MIVQVSTGDFDTVQKAQLVTSLAGAIIFLVIAYRRRQKSKKADRDAAGARKLDRSVVTGLGSALKDDVVRHNFTAQNTRGAIKKLVAEPARAHKAKKEYDGGKRAVERIMGGDGAGGAAI